LDFVHGGDDYPLFVFWLFLRIRVNGPWKEAKGEPVIPEHVWERLPDQSKEACCRDGTYDARWSKDPKVIAWRRRLTFGEGGRPGGVEDGERIDGVWLLPEDDGADTPLIVPNTPSALES
jgi:hypothetical protein